MNNDKALHPRAPNKPSRRKWPPKRDFKVVPLEAARALVAEFGRVFSWQELRAQSSFSHMIGFDRPGQYDHWDLRTALEFFINRLRGMNMFTIDDVRFLQEVEALCGGVDNPMALSVGVWPLVLPASLGRTVQ